MSKANFMKQTLWGFAGIAAAALVLVLAAPATVQAITTALVTIANGSGNPVQVREVNNGVDEPFGAALCSGPSDNCAFAEAQGGLPGGLASGFTTASTDANGNPVEALVIDYVSGVCSGPEPGIERQATVNPINGQSEIINFLTVSESPNSGSEPTVSEMVHIVVPAGATISIFDPNDAGACYLTLNGHYVVQTSKPL